MPAIPEKAHLISGLASCQVSRKNHNQISLLPGTRKEFYRKKSLHCIMANSISKEQETRLLNSSLESGGAVPHTRHITSVITATRLTDGGDSVRVMGPTVYQLPGQSNFFIRHVPQDVDICFFSWFRNSFAAGVPSHEYTKHEILHLCGRPPNVR